ncbi:putative uncharacterized protein [Clostridium sp. CAG:557]|jgi:energy-coupling factor transport system ATP-binding protein|nr:putative uncharacterized protein [Clostridium sp. CAG:557]
MEKFIDIIDLKFNYAPNDDASNILNGINLKIKKGEFLTILGHNGSGKSTLAKHLNALLLPSFGKVFVKGIDTKNESKTYDVRSIVGLVLQNPDNQLVASIVEEDVAFGPENLGICPQKIRTLVDEALKSVDMYDYRQYATYNLSGGQKQRVAIAGVLAMQPECIILDEPTAMLDPIGRQEVISTVKKLNKENGITVVLITHYMDEAVDSDRIVVVNEGQVAKVGTPKDIFSDVKFLESCQLSIPQDIELVQKLKFNGIKLYDTALNEKECVYMIRNYLNSITKK